jgi:hypothetical protein
MNIRFLHQIDRIIDTPKKLFLLDSLGALLTAFLLGVVLVQWEALFGMPRNILYPLSFVAVIFCLYSFSCYWLIGEKWRPFLRLIIGGNILYGLATPVLVILHWYQLTGLGITYFLLELLVLTLVIIIEMRALFNSYLLFR